MRSPKFLLSLLLGLALLPVSAQAYDFVELRRNLKADLGGSGTRKPKMAIVYQTSGREELKKSFNLIELKRDLAHEMVRSFRVPDPVVVSELMSQKNQTYSKLMASPSQMSSFAKTTESELVLMVRLEPASGGLAMDVKLVTASSQPLANHHIELKAERMGKNPKLAEANVKQAPKARKQRGRSAAREETVAIEGYEFVPREFMEDHNDSWIELNQTAFLNPMGNYLELGTWPKSLPDTDIRPVRLRYEYTWPDLFQFGVQANANADSGHHSSYAHFKYQLVHLEEFSFAAGYKRRLSWNSENPEFNQGQEVDAFNDQRNKSSLYMALSRKEYSLGVLGNFYLDNQKAGVGAKLLLTEDIKIVVDTYYNYYERPLIKNDAAFGVQFHSPTGSIASLAYRLDSEQVHLSVGVSW